MIIDLILDRVEGAKYSARQFYREVKEYADIWPEMCAPILRAMAKGNEIATKKALCNYIADNEYNPQLKHFICAVTWTK